MAEENALLGGEMSGHIFLGDGYYGFDDGVFVAGRIVQILAAQDQSAVGHHADACRRCSPRRNIARTARTRRKSR